MKLLRAPQQTCVNCHFFIKDARGVPTPQPLRLEITERDRALAREGDYSWHLDLYAIACSRGVWDEGHNFDKSMRHEVVVETNRRGLCFFWQHRPGMFLPAAEELQSLEVTNHQANTDRRITLIGVWVAALALVAQVLLGIAELVRGGGGR